MYTHTKQLILLFVFTILFVALVSAEDKAAPEGDEFVVVLTESNIDEELKKSEWTLVEFYAPWCGHCKALAPEYAAAAKMLHDEKSEIRLAKVDCDANSAICTKFNVPGFPTLKLFKNGEAYKEYESGRQRNDIVAWLKRKCGPAAKTLANESEVKTFLEEQKKAEVSAVIGYFKDHESSLYKEFLKSAESTDDFAFAEVLGESSEKVVLRPYFSQEKSVDVTETTSENILKFLRDNGFPLVDEINGKTFKRYVDQGIPIAVLFVKYSEEGEKQKGIDLVQKPAEALRGKIAFGYSDGEEYSAQLEMMGGDPKNLPGLAAMDVQKRANFPYKGELTSEAIQEWAAGIADGSVKPFLKSQEIPETQDEPVYVLVGKSFQDVVYDEDKDVLVEFYAPWCGHCQKLEPKYTKLAEYFQPISDKLIIAKIDATENDVSDVNIEGFPTILFFPKGKKQNPVSFEGERSVAGFKKFLKDEAVAAKDAVVDLLKTRKAEKSEKEEGHDEL